MRWYARGLRFECTRCGNCCSGPEDGVVVLQRGEAQAIALAMRMDARQFLRRFTRKIGKRRVLLSRRDGSCALLDRESGLCTVHEAKPGQCRAFPFWDGNLESPDAWCQTARECEGIAQGPLIPVEEIVQRMKKAPTGLRR